MAIIGRTKSGKPIWGPPYTWAEEMDFYRRVGDAKPLTVVHRPAPVPGAASAQPRKPPPQRRGGSTPS